LDDFSRPELENMLALARDAKQRLYAREHSFQPFRGMSLAMIFTKPSARTRVSFETVRPSV
jgi:ornithine carbamoyltransferase